MHPRQLYSLITESKRALKDIGLNLEKFNLSNGMCFSYLKFKEHQLTCMEYYLTEALYRMYAIEKIHQLEYCERLT